MNDIEIDELGEGSSERLCRIKRCCFRTQGRVDAPSGFGIGSEESRNAVHEGVESRKDVAELPSRSVWKPSFLEQRATPNTGPKIRQLCDAVLQLVACENRCIDSP